MKELMNITKALADENRVRTLMALRGGELCVCQITALFGVAPSTMSKHLSVLYQAGLVESRKEGRWIYYKLAENGNGNGTAAGREAIRWVERAATDNPRVEEDGRKLKKILKMDPVELCRKQCAAKC